MIEVSSFKLDYNISAHEKIMTESFNWPDIETLYLCMYGDLTVNLLKNQHEFKETELLYVSAALLTTVWDLVSFGSKGEEKCILIPEEGPSVCFKLVDHGIQIKINEPSLGYPTAFCTAKECIRELGKFHKSLTETLLSKNPELIEMAAFRFVYPGSAYFYGKLFETP